MSSQRSVSEHGQQIARKISSYADKQANHEAEAAANAKSRTGKSRKPRSRGQPVLYAVQSLITALAEANDGKCSRGYLVDPSLIARKMDGSCWSRQVKAIPNR